MDRESIAFGFFQGLVASPEFHDDDEAKMARRAFALADAFLVEAAKPLEQRIRERIERDRGWEMKELRQQVKAAEWAQQFSDREAMRAQTCGLSLGADGTCARLREGHEGLGCRSAEALARDKE
jgi:hypothetical protein